MIRDYVTAETQKRIETDKGVMRLKRPDVHLTYSHELAFRAALRAERTGRIESPEEIASIDPAWEADVYTMMDYIKFHRDYNGRPGDMKL